LSLTGQREGVQQRRQLQITNLSISALTVTGCWASGQVDVHRNRLGHREISSAATLGHAVQTAKTSSTRLRRTPAQRHQPAQRRALKLFFNRAEHGSLTIQSTNTSASTARRSASVLRASTSSRATPRSDTRLQALHTALTSVASQASAFGSNLSIAAESPDFTNNMVNTLQVGSDGSRSPTPTWKART